MSESTRNITILGSTGSVGANTLDIVARHPGRFRVIALTAHRNAETLFDQCLKHRPQYAVLAEERDARRLLLKLRAAGVATEVRHGSDQLEFAATLPEVDSVMAAIVGIAGLRATFAAARRGKRILLANKEALVTAGHLFMDALRLGGGTLLPIDSEHNAVFQVLPAGYSGSLAGSGVRRVVLTASGGPFRELPFESFHAVTPEQACAHPNWVMGRKISVDSATMMNKGLEIIEACWLFNAREDQVAVVLHPESVIHSLVEYVDGSMLAQLGNPDMRTPIAHALGYPERIDAGVAPLDLAQVGRLNFHEPDLNRFPCLRLAREAFNVGGAAPAVLNAANEMAVAAFLDRKLSFDRIPHVISSVLERTAHGELRELADVFEADRAAREECGRALAQGAGPGKHLTEVAARP